MEATSDEYKIQRKFAVDTFNFTWELLDKSERTQAEDDSMLNAAHASRYHWEQIGAPLNLARGDWQISRVYAVLGRAEPALYHANRCLEICQENDIGDFDLAFAYEALARASAAAGDDRAAQDHIILALKAGEAIAEEDDRQYFLSDIKTVPGFDDTQAGT